MPKKSKKQEQPKSYVWLLYDSFSSGGGIIDPDEKWSSREDAYIEFTPLQLLCNEPGVVFQEQIEIDFDPVSLAGGKVYVLVVRYTSGNTFGRSFGHWTVEGCSPDLESISKQKTLIKKDNDQYLGAIGAAKRNRKSTYLSDRGYNAWQGYFESLEQVVIYEFTLNADHNVDLIKIT